MGEEREAVLEKLESTMGIGEGGRVARCARVPCRPRVMPLHAGPIREKGLRRNPKEQEIP